MSIYELETKAKKVSIQIEEKNIKNLRLRVLHNCDVKISVPKGVSYSSISDFIQTKSKWIEKNIKKFEVVKPDKSILMIKNGSSVKILGRQYRLFIKSGIENSISKNDLTLIVKTKDTTDFLAIENQYNKYFKKEAKMFFNERVEKLYPIIKKYNVVRPEIKIRKMKTMWGTCKPLKGFLTINYHLYKAPKACIDYVILHELAHFIYPRHNKDFYNFISIYMPDWQELKRQLDFEMSKIIL